MLFTPLAPLGAALVEPVVESDQAPPTIFICRLAPDGGTTCVVIQGELSVCPTIPEGIVRRSYFTDPDQQPAVDPPSSEDIGQHIAGAQSEHRGTIENVEEIYGPGEGILDMRPATSEDLFDNPQEAFHIEGDHRGIFTTAWQECTPLAAGQEITVFPGGFYSAILLASEEMLDTNRNLLILIALNTEEAADSPEADDGDTGAGPGSGRLLIAEPEGPSFISRTVAHRRLDRRYS